MLTADEVRAIFKEERGTETNAELIAKFDDAIRTMQTTVSREERKVSKETRSFGQLFLARQAGDDTANAVIDRIQKRDTNPANADEYKGGKLEDKAPVPYVVERIVEIKGAEQVLVPLFSSAPLPAVSEIGFIVLAEDTVKAEVQEAEGSKIVSGKLKYTRAKAEVRTIGGSGELSLQEIMLETDINIVDEIFEALAARIGKAEEILTRQALSEMATANAANAVAVAANPTYVQLIVTIVNLAKAMKKAGRKLGAIILNSEDFENWISVADDDGVSAFSVFGNDTNRIGRLNPSELAGDIVGLQIVLDSDEDAVSAAVDLNAVRTYTSTNYRLSSTDPRTLTEVVALFGFFAVAKRLPKGVIPITTAA